MTQFFAWPKHTNDHDKYHNPSLGFFPFLYHKPEHTAEAYRQWCEANWDRDQFESFCIMPRQAWFEADGYLLRNGYNKCDVRTMATNIIEDFAGYDLIKNEVATVYTYIKNLGFPVAVIGGDLETPKCTLNYKYEGEKANWPADDKALITMLEVIEFMLKHYKELIPDLNYELVLDGQQPFNSYGSRQVMIGWNDWIYGKLCKKQTEIFYDTAKLFWPKVEAVNWDRAKYKGVPPEQPQSGLPMSSHIMGTANNPVFYFGPTRFDNIDEVRSFANLLDPNYPTIPWVQSHYQANKDDAIVTHEEVDQAHDLCEELNCPFGLEW